MTSMQKASTLEETARIFSSAYKETETSLLNPEEKKGIGLSRDEIKCFIQLLTSKSCGVIGNLTVDGGTALQAYSMEAILENTERNVTPSLPDVRLTILNQG